VAKICFQHWEGEIYLSKILLKILGVGGQNDTFAPPLQIYQGGGNLRFSLFKNEIRLPPKMNFGGAVAP